MEHFEIHKPAVEDLYGGTDEEHKFAIFAHKLLNGIEINNHWLQIVKLNTPHSKDDKSIFEVDFGIQIDGETIGYIDLEKKPSWLSGNWPYPKTNIALYPMDHWRTNNFNGNHTVKLQRFSQKPDMSFWIGVRADWSALWAVPFHSIVQGTRTEQSTRYSETPLPIIEVGNCYGTFCQTDEEFTTMITDAYFVTII